MIASGTKEGARSDSLHSRGPDDSRKPRIRLAIEGAVWPYAFTDVGVGDLLFADCDVYFICYCPMVTLTRGISFGGLIGGLAGLGSDKGRLEDARQTAANSRKQYYALSLDERAEQVYKSFVMRNPASVAYDAKASSITCTSHTGEKTTLYVSPMSKAALAILAEFPEGEASLYPPDDPYGLLVWSSSPHVLTEMLVRGQADAAFLDQAASHQLYMHSFYQQVRRMPPEQKDVLVENLRQTPERFRASMSLTVRDTQNQEVHTRKSTVTLGRFLGGFLIVISLAFLSSKNYFALAGLALLGLACIVYIPYLAKRTERGQERLMQAVLDATGRGKQS